MTALTSRQPAPSDAEDRLNAMRQTEASALCQQASSTLSELATVMNEETMLLRAGRYEQAAPVSSRKTQLAQDYVGLARVLQAEAPRLRSEAPDQLAALQAGHERLVTQMAENLRVLATARAVTQDLLTDVARSVGATARTHTYGENARVATPPASGAGGIAVNRAL